MMKAIKTINVVIIKRLQPQPKSVGSSYNQISIQMSEQVVQNTMAAPSKEVPEVPRTPLNIEDYL